MAHRQLAAGVHAAGIVLVEEVGAYLLVVRAEVEHLKLGKLTDGIGHNALGSEACYDDADDASLVVESHAGLVAPHVELLVEIPVGTMEGSIAIETPVLASE